MWCTENTFTVSWLDEFLTESSEKIVLAENPKRFVVTRMLADEVGFLSTTLIYRVVDIVGSNRNIVH
jgi:hypothetical protein